MAMLCVLVTHVSAQPAGGPAEPAKQNAETDLKQKLEQIIEKSGADSQEVFRARNQLVRYYDKNYRPEDAARELLEQLKSVQKRSPDSLAEAAVQQDLATQLHAADRSREAIDHAQAARRIYLRDLADDDTRTISATLMVGRTLMGTGRSGEAVPILEKVVAQREAKFGAANQLTAQSKMRLGNAYRNVGRHADAERYYLDALNTLAKISEDAPAYATTLAELSTLYQTLGRLNEAEQYAQQAVAHSLNRQGPQFPATIERMRTLAWVLVDQRRYQEAEKVLLKALEYAEQYARPPVVAGTMSDLARVYTRTRQYERAEILYRKAMAVLDGAKAGNSGTAALVKLRLGTALVSLKRVDEARPLMESAKNWYETRPVLNPVTIAYATGDLGELELVARNFPAAISLLETATKSFVELKGVDHPQTAAYRSLLGAAYLGQGDIGAAIDSYRATLKTLENFLAQRKAQSPEGRAEQEANLRNMLGRYLALTVQERGKKLPDGRDATDEAFVIGEHLRNRAVQAAVLGMSARAAAKDPELSTLVRREQDLRVERGGLETEINEGIGAGRTPPELIKKRNAVDRELADLGKRIAEGFPGYTRLMNPSSPGLTETQAALGENEAMLSYLVQDQRTLLWAITRRGAQLHVIPIGAVDLEKQIRQLRRSLDANIATLEDVPPYNLALAHELYRLLVAPAAADIAGRPNLIVVPHGPLFSLPFAALVTAPAALPPAGKVPFAEYRNLPWLGITHSVTVTPSATVFVTLRTHKRDTIAELPMIGFGDPIFASAAPAATRGLAQRNLRAGGDDLRKLARLPETNAELRQIAQALGASEQDLYLGARATETNVKRAALSRYRVVAFATHGLITGDLDGLDEPALALSPPDKATAEDDGLLTMSEILGLKLNADWVVLSACNTAAGDGTLRGDGLSGLAQAFFYAGSRALLVTLWPVESTSAQRLTTTLFRTTREQPKLTRTQALASTPRAMIQGPGMKKGDDEQFAYAHPFFWAPFILVGEGSGN